MNNRGIINLTGKRVLICEEALIDYKGHFYSWIKAIRALHQEAGAEVIVAGNVSMITEIKEEFKAYPVYTENSWSAKFDGSSALIRYLNVFRHNYRVWKQTGRLLDEIGEVDCIILPASRIYHLLGWRQLVKARLNRNFKKLVIFILTSEAVYNDNYTGFSFKKSSAFIKKVLRWFKSEVDRKSVIFAGDSHITCGEYEKLSGIPFRVFPSPAAGLEASKKQPGSVSKEFSVPAFVILGVAVIDKGIDVLQNAIIALLKDYPDLRAKFIIQWAVKTVDYAGNEVLISEELRNARQIKLIETVLSDSEYAEYMQQADFLVLPYRRKVYFNRLSGVAIEAACSGIPMIVTSNTWLHWAMDEFGFGVTVEDGDAVSLYNQILYCIENEHDMRASARQRQTIALEKNSSDKYLSLIWD